MNIKSKAINHQWFLLCLVVFGLIAALIILPYQFNSKAGSANETGDGLIVRTESHEKGIENYDIREQITKEVSLALLKFRDESGTAASAIADVRDNFVRGEEELRTRVPSLKIEYKPGINTPEVITPDMWKTHIERLTGPSSGKNADTLRNFAKQNNQLIGMETGQIDQLKVIADYTNPGGEMAFVHFLQEINGIPVFGGELKAGFTRNGEMIRAINNLASGLDYESLSTDFRNPADAVQAAFRYINAEPTKLDSVVNDAASTELKTVFGNNDWATTAEKMYFPTEPGVARAAWRVLIWQPVNAFYVVVDAETGMMLWRKNISEDQSETATYQVYANANGYINSADSPAPLTPGPINPTLGTQGALIAARTSRTLIGNELPNLGMNNLGWMTNGTNFTDGNNVEAGIDRDGTNGVDAPQPGNGTCPGAGCRIFTSTWNPPPGNPAPGDDPLTAQAQRGAVIQMFYVMNLYHDVLYNLGMNEQSFNFQTDNFGRGGLGNDRVSAEGQDSSGTNNANFATPADGGRGRMQMFLWTGPTPDYDGTTDVDVIIHEVTHGTSNRLHGNTTGLTTNMSRGMGEGWGDFYAHAMLAEPSDPINGIYTTGGYATYLLTSATDTSNYYYGIRRFPKAVIAFTGGPGNLPHNPLTFRHANADCNANINTIGAFARGPVGAATCDQVHNLGEVWSSALWEVRALMVTRLGFTAGTKRVLQAVTSGMKLAPTGPTFLQERDSIIAAASALPVAPDAGADVVDVREGFRRRGMGFSSAVTNAGTGANNTVVVEAFDTPNVIMTNPFTVTDATGNNNGVPEPGENVRLNVAVINGTGATVNNVVANVNGGANVSYGNVADGATVTMPIPFTIPGAAPCGSTQTVTINVSSALGAQTPQMRSFVLGSPVGIVQNFDTAVVPALPAGWTTTQDVGTTITWTTTTTGPSSAPNSAFANDPGTVNMSSLVSPSVPISSASAQLKFKNKYVTETNFDGMVLEMSIGAGAFQDILAAGGTFVSGGYNSTISTSFMSPIGGRMAWSGTSAGGYLDTVVNLPASANGQSVQFRWRMATDSSVTATGVNVDDVEIVSSFTCAPVSPTARAPFDFDGDNKTDIGIFRGGPGQWWVQKSSNVQMTKVDTFGTANDTLIPADFTGDGKTDIAFWRPATGAWFILRSEDSSFYSFPFGTAGDIPVPADFDGDGKADPAIFRPSNVTWYIIPSGGGATRIEVFGAAGDRPVPGDYDGDGKADKAVFRGAGQWWINRSMSGTTIVQNFGTATDKTVQGDYTGDGKTDVAFWRPSTGEWFILRSENATFYSFPFGVSTDLPVPGDYDGDGKIDAGVFRPSVVTWFVNRSTGGSLIQSFGAAGDTPIPNAYVR